MNRVSEMKRIVIVGAGLSGLMMAYHISENCEVEIVILEKGKSYKERLMRNTEELVSGAGGAGTVFGGKLCFPPASAGVWSRSILDESEFLEFQKICLLPFVDSIEVCKDIIFSEQSSLEHHLSIKDYPSTLLKQNEMRMLVLSIIEKLKLNGVHISYNCNFLNYEKDGERFRIEYNNNNIVYEECDYLVLAGGRLSSVSMHKWIKNPSDIIMQSPDLGVRTTFEYDDSSVFSSIGRDVKIKAQYGDIGVRTFCVCSGGDKVRIDLNELKYYDGHFGDNISDKVNMGILARSKHLVGYEVAELYCTCLESYLDKSLSLKDFMQYREVLIKDNNIFLEIMNSIYYFILDLQKEGIITDNLDKCPVYLPSVDRLNSMVKTDHNFETSEKGVYVIGDALGISRGFIQSMWSGYHASCNLIMKLKEKLEDERRVV